jgi:hypothetical protein
MTAAARHAVYFAPNPAHPLWDAGCRWLGRDARAGQPLQPPARAHVHAPWRYGFHATLKTPLRLAPGVRQSDWLAAVQALAAGVPAFDLPALHVARLDDFLALLPVVPVEATHPLRRLADACVIELDRFRAPMSDADRERRLQHSRSERQRAQALRYGYPHVLDDWRFHLTLTDSLDGLDPREVQALQTAAQAHFAPALQAPLRCTALAVFEEPASGEPLRWTHRCALAAGSADEGGA